ncbi:hypothetical protein AB0I94_00850 [Streptomyces sp. NPDC050147]|uniref:hypothetical protein n=1 Tax=Streptomyces sp. NPDC050147 TaxID=3155513 RepID=UPI003414EB44
MAEQDRIEPDGDESREPEKRQEPAAGRGLPPDEDAAWRAIVAGYGQEPADPPGAKPFKSIEDLALLETETNDTPDSDESDKGGKSVKNPTAPDDPDDSGSKKSLGGSVSFAPGVGGGPRDYDAPEASDDDLGADDEGHFVPPEPPPLPSGDVTAKFAWLAVLGGPLLLLLTVLLGWQMTWWLATLSIGGFLGGFATLVGRMKSDDDEEDGDPGRGAVV